VFILQNFQVREIKIYHSEQIISNFVITKHQIPTLMKKSLLLLFIVVSFLFKGFGQCEPDTLYTLPGIYPDSATGFPPAYATFEYNLVITAVIPPDTLLPIFGRRNIDSIGVVDVIGLPENFEAIPNSPSGFWPGGSSGCLLITGTPTTDQVGEYPLLFVLNGYAQGIPLPIAFGLTAYTIIVYDSIFAGIDSPHLSDLTALKAAPNPFNGSFWLQFNAVANAMFDLQIFDLNSRPVMDRTITAVEGFNKILIDASALKPGIYFCRLSSHRNEASTVLKLVKY